MAPNYDKHIKSNEGIYESYIKNWNQYNDKYMNAMEKYFNMKWPNKDEEFQALVADLPIFPRNVEDHSFYVTGYGSLIDYCKKHTQIDIKNKKEVDKVFKDKFEEISMTVVMHECCHFFFFEKCKEIFSNLEYSDCNAPSLLWHLSEMAIEPILNSKQVQDVFKYDFKANYNCYIPKKDNHLMMDDIKDIFNNNSIEEAIKIGYQYLLDNEKALREANNEDVIPGTSKILK